MCGLRFVPGSSPSGASAAARRRPGCVRRARLPLARTIMLDRLGVRAASEYAGAVRDAILALKRGERACLDPLAALMAPLVTQGAASFR